MAKTWAELTQAEQNVAKRQELDDLLRRVTSSGIIFTEQSLTDKLVDIRTRCHDAGLSREYCIMKVVMEADLRTALNAMANERAQTRTYTVPGDRVLNDSGVVV